MNAHQNRYYNTELPLLLDVSTAQPLSTNQNQDNTANHIRTVVADAGWGDVRESAAVLYDSRSLRTRVLRPDTRVLHEDSHRLVSG